MWRVTWMVVAAALLVVTAGCAVVDRPAQPGIGAVAEQRATATTGPSVPAAPVALREAAPVLPTTVRDASDRQVTVRDVRRIVSLNGDITEVIFALGLGDRVIAVDTSATYPPQAATLPKIGYQRQLAAEAIISLQPTLVIGADTAGPPAVIEQIRSSGVPVVLVAAPITLEAVPLKIRSVAAALGVPNTGAALAVQTQERIAAATALAATATSRPTVMFLYLRGSSTQQIGGRNSAADALISTAGGIDAGVAAGIEGFKPLTPEALVAAKPDVLLLLSAGLQSVGGIDGLLAIPGIAQTPAGRARRVLDYDDQYLLGLGPRVGDALMDLVRALHPELR